MAKTATKPTEEKRVDAIIEAHKAARKHNAKQRDAVAEHLEAIENMRNSNSKKKNKRPVPKRK